jgi:hypothetical protein
MVDRENIINVLSYPQPASPERKRGESAISSFPETTEYYSARSVVSDSPYLEAFLVPFFTGRNDIFLAPSGALNVKVSSGT